MVSLSIWSISDLCETLRYFRYLWVPSSVSRPVNVHGFAQGYGITLGTINALSVIISVLQAIPSLGLQVRPTL